MPSPTVKKKASPRPKYSKKLCLEAYEEMLFQRRFEEKAGQVYMQQKIKGFCHLYIGQEAVSSGIESVITKEDYIITAYRDHGFALTRGVEANAVMAEMYGKVTGVVKGKGGSMHMFNKENRLLGGHGIVGGQIPLGAGIAFAIKYREENDLCVCLMGDGAVRQGAFHEALNLAMTWKLPVIYIIENNEYAMGTSVERTSNVTDLYTLGEAYDMPSWAVNGMDFFEVHEQMKKAVKHVRSGAGPVLLEMKTYRYRGHSMSDPAKYRTKDELNEFKSQDPIIGLKSYILEHNFANEVDLKSMDDRLKAVVEESVKFAEDSPYPNPADIYQDVYSEPNYPYITE